MERKEYYEAIEKYSDDHKVEHYGILGMHWGIRRYQNEDGSYTEAGLRRYRQAEESRSKAREDYRAAKKSGDSASAAKYKGEAQRLNRVVKAEKEALRKDYKMDRGREKVAAGKSITDNQVNGRRAVARNIMLAVGSSIAANKALQKVNIDNALYAAGMSSSGASTITKCLALGFKGASYAFAGNAVVKGVYSSIENNQIRAYYYGKKPTNQSTTNLEYKYENKKPKK